MKHTIRIAALTLAAACPFTTLVSVAQADDVGVVATAQNDVTLRAAGQAKGHHVGAMQGLAENSRLQVGVNSKAIVVLYKNGARFSIPAGSVVTIGAESVKTESGDAAKSLPALKLQQAKILQSSRIAYGRPGAVLVRGSQRIALSSLLCGSTLEIRPVFKWSTVPDAVSYRVKVSDDNNKTVLERESTQPMLAYPADIPALKPGSDYIWGVYTRVGDNEYDAQGTFTVLTTAEQAALKADLDALKNDDGQNPDDGVLGSVLEAELYRKYDLVDTAVGIYEKLVKDNPDSVDFHQALLKLYAEQNRTEESKAEIEKVKQLMAG